MFNKEDAREMSLSGKLKGRPVGAFLDDLSCGNVLREALGVAVLNVLSAACWDRMPTKPYELSLGRDAFDDVELPRGGCVVVVGALVPMLKRLFDQALQRLRRGRRVRGRRGTGGRAGH